jgi:hypothetical protein
MTRRGAWKLRAGDLGMILRPITTAILLIAGGCMDSDPPPSRLASKPCAKMAESRMADARANGYTEDEQIDEFRYNYADCVKWEAKGYEPEIP